MKQKYSIGLLIIIVTVIYILFILSPADVKQEEPESSVKEEQTISTDGPIFEKECFYLHNCNGYIVVYASDHQTVYEYTNIVIDELPEILQKEIENGKYIGTKEELYGFLENYSS